MSPVGKKIGVTGNLSSVGRKIGVTGNLSPVNKKIGLTDDLSPVSKKIGNKIETCYRLGDGAVDRVLYI